MESDLQGMSTEALRQEVMRLRTGIRAHRDAKGHDRCWRDDFEVLYAMLPETTEADLKLPPKQEFLENCERYWQQRQPPVQ